MPDFNYSIDVQTNGGNTNLINFIAVDTVLMCGHSGYDWSPTKNMKFTSRRDKLRSSEYFKWVETKLQQATSANFTYIIVVGHYPVWSVSEHGPTKCLVDNLRPLLHKYKVTAYFAGNLNNFRLTLL